MAAKQLWKDLLSWLSAMDGLDDPTGQALEGLADRIRVLEDDVRRIRAGLDSRPERKAHDGVD